MNTIRAFLPQGRGLPEDIWLKRHKGFIVLLWANALGLFVFGLVRGFDLAHVFLESAIIAGFAVLGSAPWPNRDIAATVVTVGLMSASAVLVHLSGGSIEAHFHFFVMITLVPLYQSWTPFLVALVYVVTHHGLMGYIDPDSVYNHAAGAAAPFKWALIHGAFILGASIAGLIVWKMNEDLRERVDGLQVLEVKHRSARELNDGVVQDLTVAKMASKLGDHDAVDRAIDRSLSAARHIVSGLLPDEPVPGDFRTHREPDDPRERVAG